MALRIEGNRFLDDAGRTVYFRGINVGGSSKLPASPCGYTWKNDKLEEFFNHRAVSFVGRPFPLKEADEHFGRLQQWGFNLLRFLITWEAIEHAGPGIYDTEYLDYLYNVVSRAHSYGFSIWIDPHQDVWSRFTGGSGAPGWTLSLLGFNIRAFKQTGAAIQHQTCDGELPAMLWPTNYTKLACSTMFTVFFAGKTLAPRTTIKGENAQTYLQRHYLNALLEVVKRLKDLPCVIGYGTMNEPNMGWIGLEDLDSYDWKLTLGPCCTPLQSMALGAGQSVEVSIYDRGPFGFKKVGKEWLNKGHARAWKDGSPCIWEANGVVTYRDGWVQLLRPRHFCEAQGRRLDFYADFFVPFAKSVIRAVHHLQPTAFIFIEDAPFVSEKVKTHLVWPKDPSHQENVVCADHWYDGITLMMKKYYARMAWDGEGIQLGSASADQARVQGIAAIQRRAAEHMGGVPVVVGETGIPFDLNGGMAYMTGDFQEQERALDATMKAVEYCIAGSTLWNYCPDNSNKHGDHWNGEDLSLFSRDQMKNTGSPYDGGRALVAAVRPHPRRYAGIPLLQQFDIDTKEYVFKFRCTSSRDRPNEFFVPKLQYPNGYKVAVSSGTVARKHGQLLQWVHAGGGDHELRIFPDTSVQVPVAAPVPQPSQIAQPKCQHQRGDGKKCANRCREKAKFCDLHACPLCGREKPSTSKTCSS
eukprot:EG_transcript_5307